MNNRKTKKYILGYIVLVLIICAAVEKYMEFTTAKELYEYPIYIQSDSSEWYQATMNGELKKIELPPGAGRGGIRISEKGGMYLGSYIQGDKTYIAEIDCATKDIQILLDLDDVQKDTWDVEKLYDFQYQPDTGNVSMACQGNIYLINRRDSRVSVLCEGVWEKEEDFGGWMANVYSYCWKDAENIVYIDESSRLRIHNIEENSDKLLSERAEGIYYVSENGQDIYYGRTERTEHLMFYNLQACIYKINPDTGKNVLLSKMGGSTIFCGQKQGKFLICTSEEKDNFFEIRIRLWNLLHVKPTGFELEPFEMRISGFEIESLEIKKVIW